MKIEDLIREAIERNVEPRDCGDHDDVYDRGPKLTGVGDAVAELTIEINKLLVAAKASGKRSGCRTCKHRPKPLSKREQADQWANFMKTIND